MGTRSLTNDLGTGLSEAATIQQCPEHRAVLEHIAGREDDLVGTDEATGAGDLRRTARLLAELEGFGCLQRRPRRMGRIPSILTDRWTATETGAAAAKHLNDLKNPS